MNPRNSGKKCPWWTATFFHPGTRRIKVRKHPKAANNKLECKRKRSRASRSSPTAVGWINYSRVPIAIGFFNGTRMRVERPRKPTTLFRCLTCRRRRQVRVIPTGQKQECSLCCRASPISTPDIFLYLPLSSSTPQLSKSRVRHFLRLSNSLRGGKEGEEEEDLT